MRAPALKRVLPLFILASLFVAFFASGMHHQITLDALRDNRAALLLLVSEHPALATAAFLGAYILVVAVSLPGGTVMTLSGGFLFGLWTGALLNIVGASIGAILLFVIARYVAGDALKSRAGPFLKRMSAGFERNAFNYLLFMRLVPLFPFWAVNLIPALLGVPLRTYVIATVLGIIPGTLAFTSFGSGLGLIFDAGSEVDPSTVFTPTTIAVHVGLALLALLPIAIQAIMKRRAR